MRKCYLPFSPPCIGEEEIAEVVDTLRSNWITTGPKVKRFEEQFAVAVGAQTSLALSSCTAALHLALLSQGIGPGDVVVTTPMTFCSGVHVIEQVGARPLLVDVEPDTLNIDSAKLKFLLSNLKKRRNHGGRVKALIPVHLYGHPCEMDTILGLAQELNLTVIEDAAHALPANYKGRSIGLKAATSSVEVLTCFSFYATKNMTTAEGGMLTGSAGAIDEARIWSLHGMNRDAWKRYAAEGTWHYDVIRPGFKYNMTDLQAAIGIHQLAKLSQFRARRAQIACQYTAAFSHLKQFQVPAERAEVEHAWHLYVLRLNADRLNISRNQFIEELGSRNIASSVHFIPIHRHPYYRDKYHYKEEDFPVANREYQRIVSLPLHPGMSDQDVSDVIEAVGDIARKHKVSSIRPHRTEELLVNKANARPVELFDLTNRHASGVGGGITRSALQRIFETACSAIGLVILAPLFAAIAAAIRLGDGGPVFYSQLRVGLGLKMFHLLKFRSMVPNSDVIGLVTAREDSRVTRVGRFLRKYKLDELPQLVNVVKGEMQLVGTRPEVEQYVKMFPDQYAVLLRVRPGITDLASLVFRHEEQRFQPGPVEKQYVSHILPRKLQLSLHYFKVRSFHSDLEIIVRTIFGLKAPTINGRSEISARSSLKKTLQ